MRISPITANFQRYSTSKQKLRQMPTNTVNNEKLPQAANYYPVNFKGVPMTVNELAKQIPLEDRLASIFQNFKLGDLILVGKNLSESAKMMYNTTGAVKNAIKRGFFIADDKLDGNIGFIKNMLGDTEVINLNDNEISLISENKTYSMKPKESFYVINGDVLNINGNLLKIKEKSKTDLSMFRKSFCRAFDFQKEVEPQIEKINKKTLSALIQKKHKTATPVTFAQVGGMSKLKDALKKDIIYPLRYPDAYENVDLNRGFILYGQPGTGKTHIVRALANEAEANFIGLNGLDLESKWVGESEANWRQLFEEAKANQPTIIFLDEFDAVARSRDSKDEYGNKVVNQILTLMTDIDNEGDNVFVIGATNNYKALDNAITRSGRFGKHYEVPAPDLDALREIFDIHASKKSLDSNIDKEKMLKQLLQHKATGADVKHIINEAHTNGFVRAGIFEKMDNKTYTPQDNKDFKITQEDFDKAIADFLKDKNSGTRKPIGYI